MTSWIVLCLIGIFVRQSSASAFRCYVIELPGLNDESSEQNQALLNLKFKITLIRLNRFVGLQNTESGHDTSEKRRNDRI